MSTCLFCRIVAGESPASMVVAVDEREQLFRVASAVLDAQREAGLPADGANVLVNDGPAANQSIPHVHVHVVPRGEGDGGKALASFLFRRIPILGAAASRVELDRIARRLREAISPATRA